jgi:hypothetical protein
VQVPFTLAHGAAALPFRRLGLVFSALVVGTFAPDFEYLVRLTPGHGFGHTLLGTFVLTLPLALVVLWLFHAYVKLSAVRLLPHAVQRKLTNHLEEFRFGGVGRCALIVGSILLGIATHLLWDSFTHPNTWPYRHWPVLAQSLPVPVLGMVPVYKLLQHGSTTFGLGALAIWLMVRYRWTKPSGPLSSDMSPARKIFIMCAVMTVALVGAAIRGVIGVGIPSDSGSERRFVGLVVVTAISLIWWQLVAYGIFMSGTNSFPHKRTRP